MTDFQANEGGVFPSLRNGYRRCSTDGEAARVLPSNRRPHGSAMQTSGGQKGAFMEMSKGKDIALV